MTAEHIILLLTLGPLILGSLYLLWRHYQQNAEEVSSNGILVVFRKAKGLTAVGMYFLITMVLGLALVGTIELTSDGESEKLDCGNKNADYDLGYASGQMTYMMGSDCTSCCYSYVQKYNQNANSLLEANPCFCQGFKDGVISKRPSN
jgi:hypothetical protein